MSQPALPLALLREPPAAGPCTEPRHLGLECRVSVFLVSGGIIWSGSPHSRREDSMRHDYSEMGNINGPFRSCHHSPRSGPKDSCPYHVQNTFTPSQEPPKSASITALAQSPEFHHLNQVQAWMKLLRCSSNSEIGSSLSVN